MPHNMISAFGLHCLLKFVLEIYNSIKCTKKENCAIFTGKVMGATMGSYFSLKRALFSTKMTP